VAPRRPGLIPLPAAFDVLYQSVRGRKCAACGLAPACGGLCLLCGELVCLESKCCRGGPESAGPGRRGAGEATTHARACGGGAGAFLALAGGLATCVLLVRGRHAAYRGSLYVDAHGEPDVGLRRGRLLALSPARAAALGELLARGGLGREVVALRQVADAVVIDNVY